MTEAARGPEDQDRMRNAGRRQNGQGQPFDNAGYFSVRCFKV